MDFDGDGKLDLVSGCYDPGDLYLAKGLNGGGLSKLIVIKDEGGTPLVHHPVERKEIIAMGDKAKNAGRDDKVIRKMIASFGSWPEFTDWDGDGDLDLLVGSFSGQLFLRENIGTREKPVYSEKSTGVQAGSKPLKVEGHCHPVSVDWDSDGLKDLVVGSADGSVRWFKNMGTKTKPVFKDSKVLVKKKCHSKFHIQSAAEYKTVQPGGRAQICVGDWNGDGKLDLLVGTHSYMYWQKKGLKEKEKKDFEETYRKFDELIKVMHVLSSKRQKLAFKKYQSENGKGEKFTEEDQKKMDKIDEEVKPLQEKYEEFFKTVTEHSEEKDGGFIWIYLRK